MPRQANTAAPRNARTAPTVMKTVPSGRLDFCINGASAVLGTIRGGGRALASVGRFGSLETVEDGASDAPEEESVGCAGALESAFDAELVAEAVFEAGAEVAEAESCDSAAEVG